MAFVKLISTATKLQKMQKELVEEKAIAIQIFKKEPTKKKFRHYVLDVKRRMKKLLKNCLSCYLFKKFCYNLRHEGSCENYTLKSIIGFVCGFILTYIFFMFSMFQLNFALPTATVFCSILGIVLMIGLAFSTKVRCVVLLTLPQFFSQKGRQALLAYAFILAISGPAKNMLNNMGILSESLACGQEQLKEVVRQIIDVIKRPFLAIKEAIKKVVKTVKEIMKKIKEILLTIKRVIMAILKVIKAAFQFLAKIINICNKELGTPFERCTRVFENAIVDCNAKLGPMFNWLCSLAYIVQSVCYMVKFLDLICMIVDFISDSVIGVVIRKVKTFIRHIKTLFYVRMKFYHSFQFQTNSSKTMAEVAHEMVAEIRERTEILRAIFKFMTSAATIFFLFIIIKVTYYRYKFMTSERFDNKYVNKDFRAIDMRRAKLGKETVLPLNDREIKVYVSVSSKKLAKSEKKALAKAASTLATVSVKLAIIMIADYSLFWMLNLISYYGKFQSKVQGPNMPTVHISGNGFLADILKSIVKAFQPAGIQLQIDTVPCLPTPIPPNFDRYVQIATILLICWVLTLLEPYGLRLRHIVMCYYHPTRAKQRAIWLYNHIMRARNSFLKFARRQLRRKVLGDDRISKVTCKEYMAANFKICRLCLGEGAQTCCLLCGEVFRESDKKKPIRCHTPDCPGIYCERCFADLQNLCTVCLSPIEYGDLSDISEEKDSSEEEPKKQRPKKSRIKKCMKWFQCSKCCRKCCPQDEEEEEDDSKIKTKTTYEDKDSSDEESKLLIECDRTDTQDKIDDGNIKAKDSDYYSSSDNSTDYSYSYQYDKSRDSKPIGPIITPFRDVEKQEVPDYASMNSFKDEEDDVELMQKIMLDKATAMVRKRSVGTIISGTTFEENRKGRKVEFFGVPAKSKVSIRKKKKKRKKKPKRSEERPLLDDDSCSCSCTCSESDDDDLLKHLQSPVLSVLRSSSSSITQIGGSHYSSSSEDKNTVESSTDSDVPVIIPTLDLSNVEIHIPDTSSSLDSEIKCSHEYVKMVPINLSSSTSSLHSTKNYVSDIFGNVTYDEVSESPKSTSSSSRLHSESTEVSSSINQTPESIPERLPSSTDKVKVDKGVPSSTPIKVDVGVSVRPEERYKFEENQRKKIKQYYNAVQKIPLKKTEEKKKPGKFMKFVHKIMPKRRKSPDALPLYSKETVELNTYDYTPDNWATPHSPALRSAPNRESNISSEEEGGERVRGGQSGRMRNFHRTLSRCDTEETSLSEIDSVFLTNSQDILARYFGSIEDLTPTRDSDTPMTASKPLRCCRKDELLIRDLPEKDTTHNTVTRPAAAASQGHPSATALHNLQTTSSSNLSEAFCTSVLGVACSIGEFTNPSSSSRVCLPSKEGLDKRDNLTVIPETETSEESEKTTSGETRGHKDTLKKEQEKIEQKDNHTVPLKKVPTCVSAQCSCQLVVNEDCGVQTCPQSILKQRSDSERSVITIKPAAAAESEQSQSIYTDTGTDTDAMAESITNTTDRTVETTENYPVRDPKYSRNLMTSDKTQQTSDNSMYTSTPGFEETSESTPFTNSSSSYCYCQCGGMSHNQCTHGCCKCPPPAPQRFEEFVNLRDMEYGGGARRRYPEYEKYNKYMAEVPSEYSMRSRRPTRRDYMEFDTDCGYSPYREQAENYRYPPERPKSRQKPANIMICSCTGDCRSCVQKHASPQRPPPSHYRPPQYKTSSSEPEEEDEEEDYMESSCFSRPNRHDLPYQNSEDYLDLVQELEETLQSRNRNRVKRAMHEFERRSRYNKPLDKPIIDYDETSESEEPIIQKISQLTSEKQRCCAGKMCTCRKPDTKAKPSQEKRSQPPKQRTKAKVGGCRRPQISQSEGIKTRWKMDMDSGEWYKVAENQQRSKGGRQRSRTPSPRRPCLRDCNCCAKKYDYR